MQRMNAMLINDLIARCSIHPSQYIHVMGQCKHDQFVRNRISLLHDLHHVLIRNLLLLMLLQNLTLMMLPHKALGSPIKEKVRAALPLLRPLLRTQTALRIGECILDIRRGRIHVCMIAQHFPKRRLIPRFATLAKFDIGTEGAIVRQCHSYDEGLRGYVHRRVVPAIRTIIITMVVVVNSSSGVIVGTQLECISIDARRFGTGGQRYGTPHLLFVYVTSHQHGSREEDEPR
mmetsp:Transcript_12342/g.26596  ORF Transcript_12342/g.26596 Transcript_12342/m.26596 type:complete len:232 (-) Transcript_12342:415-1110(-)